MQSKQEFFHSGVDNQKRPDIVIDLRRIDAKKILDWTKEQKLELKEWLDHCEDQFRIFKKELLKF